MKQQNSISRRNLIKTSMVGLAGITLPFYANGFHALKHPVASDEKELSNRYPAIDDEIVSEVVGASHFNLERVKELVDARPELARASWDWGFGDWETAIGAASHVGRRDIIEYLLGKGARPSIFTYATLGSYEVVKSMIDFSPGLQRTLGPHGWSLMHHARLSLRMQDEMTQKNIDSAKKLVDYLEELGDADSSDFIELEDSEKEYYVGDYRYGDGPKDGFSVKLNMRKLISLGELGGSGGALYQIAPGKFIYNGAPSTVITFQKSDDKVVSLTVTEPGNIIIAKKAK